MSELRFLLQDRARDRWKPASPPSKPATRAAREWAEQLLGDPAVRLPDPADLEAAQVAVSALVASGTPPADWPRRWERLLPWILFAPGDAPLYANGSLRVSYASFLEQVPARRRARRLTGFLLGLFLYYPRGLPVDRWRLLLEEWVRTSDSVRLLQWREFIRDLRLLADDAPTRLALGWVHREEPAIRFVGRHFTEGAALDRSAFHSAVAARALAEMRGSPALDLTELERRLSLVVDGRSRARFPRLRHALAEGLLLPYGKHRPPPEILTRIRDLLIHRDHLGDPRLPRDHRWDEIPEAKSIFLRWLANEALDLFLQVVSETAEERHWRFRRPFWEAYLHKGLVDEAWVALGRKAAAIARRTKCAGRRYHGRLVGASQTHSVILLRIGDITIAEWSHSGTCRAWLGSSRWTPGLYEADYRADELRLGPDFKKRHHGSEAGRWQADVEHWIRRQTGARVKRSDYMPWGNR